MQTGKPSSAAVSSAFGSVKARISLRISAPAFADSRNTSAFELSTEIKQSKRLLTASTSGTTRSISCETVTISAFGRVDSPPMSIISAPSLSIFSTWKRALSNEKNLPESEKESGVKFKMPIIFG